MLNKIKVLSVIASICCILPSSVYANHYEVNLNLDDYSAVISGSKGIENAGKSFSLLILNPQISLNAMPSENGIQKVYEGVLDEKGRFSVSFPINTSSFAQYGNLSVKIKTEDASATEENLYCADSNEISTMLSDFNSIASKTNAEAVQMIQQYADVLSINTDAFKEIDKTNLVMEVCGLVSRGQLTQANIDTLQKTIREKAVLEALRQNKSAEMFDGDEMMYENTVKLQGIDSAYEITAYSIYESELTATGKSNVRKFILGKQYTSLNEMYKDFARAVIIEGIRNNVSNGYGHIGRILTSNAAFVGMNIANYSSNATLDNRILQGNASTIGEIEGIIALGNPVVTSSGGGGGGYSPSVITQAIAPQTNADGISDLDVPTALQAFDDLGNYSWANNAIGELLKLDIISRSGDRLFRPSNNITREEFAKMIAVAFDFSGQPEEKVFADVTDDDWSSNYIYALVKAGIVAGKSENEFGKKDVLSRQDMATIIYRVAETKGLDVSGEKNVLFDDAADIDEYAAAAVEGLSSAGIISGNGDGLFRPKNCCTRAECATVIYRLIQLKSK